MELGPVVDGVVGPLGIVVNLGGAEVTALVLAGTPAVPIDIDTLSVDEKSSDWGAGVSPLIGVFVEGLGLLGAEVSPFVGAAVKALVLIWAPGIGVVLSLGGAEVSTLVLAGAPAIPFDIVRLSVDEKSSDWALLSSKRSTAETTMTTAARISKRCRLVVRLVKRLKSFYASRGNCQRSNESVVESKLHLRLLRASSKNVMWNPCRNWKVVVGSSSTNHQGCWWFFFSPWGRKKRNLCLEEWKGKPLLAEEHSPPKEGPRSRIR
jgi:hypothetical protein